MLLLLLMHSLTAPAFIRARKDAEYAYTAKETESRRKVQFALLHKQTASSENGYVKNVEFFFSFSWIGLGRGVVGEY